MNEERGTYHLHHDDPDGDVGEVPSIDDILRQLIDERDWPPPPGGVPGNSNGASANDDSGHGDA